VYYVFALIWMHFVADFVFQSDKMALNKSKSNKWLFLHAWVYSIPFAFFGIRFALVTLFFHFVTDYITSRGTSYLWKKEQRHWFFTLIGFDQAVHLTTLLLTYQLLGLTFPKRLG
jgi:membrane-bound metal-dependent hydrolase YbcI (DUF457 family)